MSNVIAISKCETDSWNAPPPRVVALASDRDAAKRWIQDEVDGLHNSGTSYASGHAAEWWLEYGTFKLEEMEIHE